jgi:hypothetical protein
MGGCHDTCRGSQQTAMLFRRDQCIAAARDGCPGECLRYVGFRLVLACFKRPLVLQEGRWVISVLSPLGCKAV